jgi:hypothetical protein
MSNRIPASLKWLIDKRSRTHGTILRLTKEKSDYVNYIDEKINRLEEDLYALDRSLSLHEIKITPEVIPPNYGWQYKSKLKHGDLSKLIIQAIEKSCDKQATARDIRIYVAIQASLKLNISIPEKSIMYSVKDQIKNLCRSGKLKRVPFEEKGPRRHYAIDTLSK